MNAFGLPGSPNLDVQTFFGTAEAFGVQWQTWRKPVNKSMCNIFIVGPGGDGGNGVVGANSNAGGGAGGASGAQLIFNVPLALLPDVLYLSMTAGSTTGVDSKPAIIAFQQDTTANHCFAYVKSGGKGANGSGGSGGAQSSGASVSTAAEMPLGFPFLASNLAGRDGLAGGGAVSAGAYTIPVTGTRVTGGTGGGGLPAAAAAGTNGGSYTAITAPSLYPLQKGGTGSATAIVPADNGSNGYIVKQLGFFGYGGTGAASTHGTATGGGLVGGNGGNGGPGCGGGGGGGALTGSSQGLGGKGGPSMAIITCW